MNFSSILDISSFFIGMIINLILVSLMCYYFKRKYEILENAQTEQAKILYELLRRDNIKRTENFCEKLDEPPRVDYTKDPLINQVVISDSDSESDSDSDSDSEYEITLPDNPPSSPREAPPELSRDSPRLSPSLNLEKWMPTEELKLETKESMVETTTKEIVIDLEGALDTETNYSKMSIKQLKDILTSKGVKHKHNMKKDELLVLVKDIDAEVII